MTMIILRVLQQASPQSRAHNRHIRANRIMQSQRRHSGKIRLPLGRNKSITDRLIKPVAGEKPPRRRLRKRRAFRRRATRHRRRQSLRQAGISPKRGRFPRQYRPEFSSQTAKKGPPPSADCPLTVAGKCKELSNRADSSTPIGTPKRFSILSARSSTATAAGGAPTLERRPQEPPHKLLIIAAAHGREPAAPKADRPPARNEKPPPS